MAKIKGLTLLAAFMAMLWVGGCGGLPYRCSTRPCWYDESRGVGATYYDPQAEPGKQHYYLGRDPSNLKKVIRLYGSTGYYPPNPYVYQPGSSSWGALCRWSIVRPYIIPSK
ncbi:MAG: hypothetical protein FJ128_10675 [Deltaproteobacteria bacterium]|nr:hypothetical protein [Deltaproteobacteria bacterium]MBM4287879.1 hypothetical protein [Deltaproteobacteria bacterium]